MEEIKETYRREEGIGRELGIWSREESGKSCDYRKHFENDVNDTICP